MQIILENVRSFAGRHQVTIKPLTILTGENSSGKSTFMAATSMAIKGFYTPGTNFNEPPFELGNYSTIATQSTGRPKKNTPFFCIGYSILKKKAMSTGDRSRYIEVIGRYEDRSGRPVLAEVTVKTIEGEAIMSISDNSASENGIGTKVIRRFIFETQDGEKKEIISEHVINTPWRGALYLILAYFSHRSPSGSLSKKFKKEIQLISQAIDEVAYYGGPIIQSIAPIRSKPKRTYDQATEFYNPEGDHIPFFLDRLSNELALKKQWKQLLAALKRFGKESGLFQDFKVRNLGKKAGEPFQLLFSIDGIIVNMADVGYGVSQMLPIIVESLMAHKQTLLLLQQPEVHLHPRAQAALGSFFAELVSEQNKWFMIETHSDYIIDRVRQEVATGKILPNDIALLFFEKEKGKTTIHELTLDESGNILNPPDSYQEFFLKEAYNLLTRTSHTT